MFRYFNPRTLAGATVIGKVLNKPVGISIHAPLRVRRVMTQGMNDISKFQSTHPCGCDATLSDNKLYFVYFNPRTLAGATRIKPSHSIVPAFQSTHPCGCDYCPHCGQKLWWHFNPRTLAGATGFSKATYWTKEISIHAPLRVRRAI